MSDSKNEAELMIDISDLLDEDEVQAITAGGLDPNDYTVLPLQASHIESRKNPQSGGRLVICVYEVQAGVFQNDTSLFLGTQGETEFLLNKVAFAPSVRLVMKKAEMTQSVKDNLRMQLNAMRQQEAEAEKTETDKPKAQLVH